VIIDTHLVISNILYKYLSDNMNFKLDRVAFAYGNIKPDFIDNDIKCQHTLDDSLYYVNKYSEKLMKDNLSIKEFSISLGIICHFACDYFCIYHREGNEKKGIIEHLFYELTIHIKLITLLLRGKLKLTNYEILENSLESIILKLQENYILEEKGLTRDIDYTLSAALQISKLIVYSCQLYPESPKTSILKEHLLR
jgi:hypothetical protein